MRVLLAIIFAVYPLVATPPMAAAAPCDPESSMRCCCCCEAGACPCAGPATPDEPPPAPAPSAGAGEAHRWVMLSPMRTTVCFLVSTACAGQSSFVGAARAIAVRERLAILCVRLT